jgi:RNA polymerase sigma-70 factor, ECF subfamily
VPPSVIPERLLATIHVMEARTAFAFTPSAAVREAEEVARFEAIYREHFASVEAYARRRLSARADDVVAETFLVAWRRFDQVPEDALPWLYGVARRVASDVRRSSARQVAVVERLARVPTATSSHQEGNPALPSALARLPERDRELLFLVYWEDLDPRRAAAALGCSRATVATTLWRAHRRLRNELNRMRGDVQ